MFGFTACDKLTPLNMLDQILESGEPFFSILYTEPFARRFSLPVNKATNLPDNLKAIAIEINKVNYRYTCELHLYIDDKLDIHKPVTGNFYSEKSMAEQFFIYGYNSKDQVWISSSIDKNSMQIRLDATPQADYKFTSTLSYSRVHSSFLPGLTVVSLNTDCSIFERDRYPADIWIQKQGVGDYLVGNDGPGGVKHKDKNHRFPIPVALIEQIQPYIEIAEKYNDERL